MEVIVQTEKTMHADWCATLVATLFTTKHITFNGNEIDTVTIDGVDESRVYLSIFNLPFI